jgi:hypothetical protein
MKKYRFLLYFGLLVQQSVFAQYLGGLGKGNSQNSVNTSLSASDGLFEGGAGSGNIQITTNIYLGKSDGLFEGGVASGITQINVPSLILSINDGLYNGGNGKGDSKISLKTIRLSRCNDLQLVWNGNQTVFWGNPSNWDCGTVPNHKSLVTIPSNTSRMPLIVANALASKVTILSIANITVFGANGQLTITGQ